jgi:hypothetical protein
VWGDCPNVMGTEAMFQEIDKIRSVFQRSSQT